MIKVYKSPSEYYNEEGTIHESNKVAIEHDGALYTLRTHEGKLELQKLEGTSDDRLNSNLTLNLKASNTILVK
jgi:hypothetical protein